MNARRQRERKSGTEMREGSESAQRKRFEKKKKKKTLVAKGDASSGTKNLSGQERK